MESSPKPEFGERLDRVSRQEMKILAKETAPVKESIWIRLRMEE